MSREESPNKDIKSIAAETGIGVGSVVLHLRKNKQSSSQQEGKEDQYLTVSPSDNGTDEFETVDGKGVLDLKVLHTRSASNDHQEDALIDKLYQSQEYQQAKKAAIFGDR